MKVSGIALHGGNSLIGGTGPRPLEAGFFPIDDFTGILGRNDSGKSTLLSCAYDLLNGESRLSGIVFAEVERDRFREILRYCLADLVEDAPSTSHHHSRRGRRERDTWWANEDGLTAERLENVELLDESDLTGHWFSQLRVAYDGSEPHSWEQIISYLENEADESRRFLVAFEPVYGGSESTKRKQWNLLLCLPPVASTPPDVVTALKSTGVLQPDWSARANLRHRSRVRLASSGHRDHLGGPVVLAPMGRISIPLLPRPLFPRGQDSVLAEAEQAIEDCVKQLRWAEFLISYEENDQHKTIDDVVGDSWLEVSQADRWALSKDVSALCRKLEHGIAEVLPAAVSRDYRVRLRVNPPERWSRNRLRIVIEPVDRDFFPNPELVEESGVLGIDQVAEGFHLWVNISILYAVNVIQLAAAHLALLNGYLDSWLTDRWLDSPTALAKVAELKVDLRGAVPKIRNPKTGLAVATSSELWFLDDEGEAAETAAAELVRGRLLLIDEPERFLHPKLQRDMASWLDRSVTQGIPVLVTTHSVPFMGLRGDASYTYLLREGNAATQFLPISPGELSKMGLAAEELGLDRGELLALINVVLWVEGEMDREVLMRAFPTQLREAGVLVVPMKGYKHTKAKAVLETSLMRFSSAQVAVWLDGVDRKFVEKVTADPKAAQREAQKSSAREPETVAKLVHEAARLDRSIHPIGVDRPGYDVFDLIDENVVMERFPAFPGHHDARARFEELVDAGGAKQSEWKNYWAKWFQITVDERTCGELAAEMRRTDRITEPLWQVAARCQDIAKVA